MSLRIGTSGCSYPTGKGTWNGVFYPATRSKRDGTKDFDELRFYAEHFDTVEVNSTFYGTPRADVTRQWASRTPVAVRWSARWEMGADNDEVYGEWLGRTPAQLADLRASGVI